VLPGQRVLDVGCGPGSITLDVAERVAPGEVVGVDSVDGIIEQAQSLAAARGADAQFKVDNTYSLSFADDSFDVVMAHQVLQHLADPVGALKEMRRVSRPGALIAARDADYESMLAFPSHPGIDAWRSLVRKNYLANSHNGDAGRYVRAWFREAGFAPDDLQFTVQAVSYSFDEEDRRRAWGEAWCTRTLESNLARQALERGLATQEELDAMAAAWLEWAANPEGVFYYVNGQVLARASK